MSTIATVTPNLRSGYDRKMLELLSNRRESVPLIVVLVGDRTSKIATRSTVMFKTSELRLQVADRSYMVATPIGYGRTTNPVWSHHQSCVIVCQAVARSVVRPVTSCPDWLYDRSACFPRSPFAIARHDWWYA